MSLLTTSELLEPIEGPKDGCREARSVRAYGLIGLPGLKLTGGLVETRGI